MPRRLPGTHRHRGALALPPRRPRRRRCELSGVVDVDDESLVLDVRPGTFGEPLEAELRATHGATLGHWPQSVAISTVGGWLACRGAGQLSTRYGKIEDMVVGLDVALADGRHITTGGRAEGGRRSGPHPAVRRIGGHPGGHHRCSPPASSRTASGTARRVELLLVRRRPRRLPPDPSPRRHTGGASSLRRRRGQPELSDR